MSAKAINAFENLLEHIQNAQFTYNEESLQKALTNFLSACRRTFSGTKLPGDVVNSSKFTLATEIKKIVVLALIHGDSKISRMSSSTLANKVNTFSDAIVSARIIDLFASQYPWFAEKWKTVAPEEKLNTMERLRVLIEESTKKGEFSSANVLDAGVIKRGGSILHIKGSSRNDFSAPTLTPKISGMIPPVRIDTDKPRPYSADVTAMISPRMTNNAKSTEEKKKMLQDIANKEMKIEKATTAPESPTTKIPVHIRSQKSDADLSASIRQEVKPRGAISATSRYDANGRLVGSIIGSLARSQNTVKKNSQLDNEIRKFQTITNAEDVLSILNPKEDSSISPRSPQEKFPKDLASSKEIFAKKWEELVTSGTEIVQNVGSDERNETLNKFTLAVKEMFPLISHVLSIAWHAHFEAVKDTSSEMQQIPIFERSLARIRRYAEGPIEANIDLISNAGGTETIVMSHNIVRQIEEDVIHVHRLGVTILSMLSMSPVRQGNTTIYMIAGSMSLLAEVSHNLARNIETRLAAAAFTMADHFDPGNRRLLKRASGSSSSIWDEIIEEPTKKMDDFPKLSLPMLVAYLTSPPVKDKEFEKVFLMTYHSFTNPNDLFELLQERFDVPKTYKKESRENIKIKVATVLRTWVNDQFNDFDANLLGKVIRFVQRKIMRISLLEGLGQGVLTEIEEKIKSKHACEVLNNDVLKVYSMDGASLDLLSYKPKEIAEQLTLISIGLYQKIKPVELFNQAWSKKELRYRSPFVLADINRVNSLGRWVATSIITEPNTKKRAELYSHFVRIAECLKEMQNFNNLMGILAGLSLTSVNRMKGMKGLVKKKIVSLQDNLTCIFNSEKNWANYRGILEKCNLPAIPYLGIFLTDLTFIEDGNPDTIARQVNWRKRILISKVIEKVQRFQNSHYNITRSNPLYTYLSELPHLEEDQLFKLSQIVEPKLLNSC